MMAEESENLNENCIFLSVFLTDLMKNTSRGKILINCKSVAFSDEQSLFFLKLSKDKIQTG